MIALSSFWVALRYNIDKRASKQAAQKKIIGLYDDAFDSLYYTVLCNTKHIRQSNH